MARPVPRKTSPVIDGGVSVSAFQDGAYEFGVGCSGGIRKAILISEKSVASSAGPHMPRGNSCVWEMTAATRSELPGPFDGGQLRRHY
jgi:hypothetical protein